MVEPIQRSRLQSSRQIFLDRYSLVKKIGYDEKAKIFLGFDLTTKQHHAIKIIKHTQPNFNLEVLKKEVELLLTLKHPNVVNIIEFHESVDYIAKDGGTCKVAAIVMEYISGGSLFEYIEYSGGFSEEVARKCFQVIIEALEYCHSKGVFHRDLKVESLMLDKDLNIKIVSFMSTAFVKDRNADSDNGAVLDLFSASKILFYMVKRRFPFSKADPIYDPWYKLLCNWKYDIFWKAHDRYSFRKDGQKFLCSAEFKNLINTMFDFEPTLRLSIAELRFHPWYQMETMDVNATLKELAAHKTEENNTKLAYQKEILKEKARLIKEHAGRFQKIPFKNRNQEVFIFRGRSEENEILDQQELDILGYKRKIEEYEGIPGAKTVTEIWTVFDTSELFTDLYKVCKIKFQAAILNKQRFQIQVKHVTDLGSANVEILLTKINNDITCIEFHKKRGDCVTFMETINQVKVYLNIHHKVNPPSDIELPDLF